MNIKKLNLAKFSYIIIFVTLLIHFLSCASPKAPIKNSTTLKQEKKTNINTAPVQQKIEQQVKHIPLPNGFFRADEAGEMTIFCRNLDLRPLDKPVKLFNGKLKVNQNAHYAILNIDVGKKDLQQCADAVMRLRAEYLFSKGLYEKIQFSFTSGDKCSWRKWQQGWRPIIKGNKVDWIKNHTVDSSYQNFRQYLNLVFTYAGSASLSKEMKTVPFSEMQIGDVLIQGGFPGHAVIVLDMAQNSKEEKIFLLAQSYMPAQDIHILINPGDKELSPWYILEDIGNITTPEWNFKSTDLKRFH